LIVLPVLHRCTAVVHFAPSARGAGAIRGRRIFSRAPFEQVSEAVRFSWAACLIFDISNFANRPNNKELRRILSIERLSVRILHVAFLTSCDY
jgi:hypothetical protein